MLFRLIKDPVGLPLDERIERERTESYVQPALCNSSHLCPLGGDAFYPQGIYPSSRSSSIIEKYKFLQIYFDRVHECKVGLIQNLSVFQHVLPKQS